MKYKNLKSFLYMLMRDSFQTGEVVRIINEVEKTKGMEITFTSQHLANYAEELSERILEDK
jgi:hypothetical protein